MPLLFSQAVKNSVTNKYILNLTSHDDCLSTTHHYKPYDSSHKNLKHHEFSDSQPFFWDNESSFNIQPKYNPTCIICCWTNHCLSECKGETMAKGKPTFAKVVNGQLIHHSNNSPLCITFNLNNSQNLQTISHFHPSCMCPLWQLHPCCSLLSLVMPWPDLAWKPQHGPGLEGLWLHEIVSQAWSPQMWPGLTWKPWLRSRPGRSWVIKVAVDNF